MSPAIALHHRAVLAGVFFLIGATVAVAQPRPKAMTPSEAAELLKSRGEMEKFVEYALALPVKRPVQIEFVSVEELRARNREVTTAPRYLEMSRRTEAALKKVGLLPRDFDLQAYTRDLENEEPLVRGYYDPKTQKVYIGSWLSLPEARAVAMHEMVHAVQDQNIVLADFLDPMARSRAERDMADEENYHPDIDEAVLAKRAVVEGQAHLAMEIYVVTFARERRTTTIRWGVPEVQRAFLLAFPMLNTPRWKKAPGYFRYRTAFPYDFGYNFIWELMDRGQTGLAVCKALESPPTTTREVMHPKEFADGKRFPSPRVPKLQAVVGEEWELLWVATAGQLDVHVLLHELAGEQRAERLLRRYAGGVWHVFQQRRAEAAAAPLGLVWASQWQDTKSAEQFIGTYGVLLRRKYKTVTPLTQSGSFASWATEEGAVSAERIGNRVLVMEGLPEGTAQKVRNAQIRFAGE